MICVEELWKAFGAQEVLRGVSLEVPAGEFLALVGLSGCGKSLLLKHVVRLMAPDRGRVLVGGQDLAALSRRELEATRSRIGYVFQNSALFDSLTVYENVAFPLQEKTRLREAEIRRKVMAEARGGRTGRRGRKVPGRAQRRDGQARGAGAHVGAQPRNPVAG